MTSVLYDVPGPRARVRNAILAVITVIVVAAGVGLIVYRFAVTGQFDPERWTFLGAETVQRRTLEALGRTLSAFGVAAVASLVLGLLLSVGRLSDHAWIRVPVMLFTEFFRAVPVLILMMIMYYGLPPLGINWMTPFLAVVIGLTLYNGSVLAEVFRSGVESLPRGQREAGLAIGLRKSGVMSSVLYPQGIRAMMPVIISQLVVVLKDTALGFIVTFNELLYLARFYGSQVTIGSPIIPSAIVYGSIYIILCLILSGVAKWVEVRMRRNPKVQRARSKDRDSEGGRPPVAGVGIPQPGN